MSSVKLSVCIPVYNGADFIAQAIDSVLGQSFTDLELLVVDNNSTDNTCAIVEKYQDPRIRLIKNDSNIGLVPNWNKAIENARGEYIKILPADDFIYPDALRIQCDILDNDRDKRISIVCGRKNIIDSKGKILFNRGFANKEMEVPGIEAIGKVIRSGGNIIGEGGTILFRKEILARTGNFSSDIFYVLDLDLWFRMLALGNLYVLPVVVSAFRLSSVSASVQVAKQQRKDMFAFIDKVYANEKYKLSWLSYKTGLIKSFLLTEAKKLLYKYTT